MRLGAEGRLAVTASPTASQLQHLWTKGFLRSMEPRLEPLIAGNSAPEALAYGVGCVTSHGVSLGLPLETIWTHLLSLEAAVTFNLSKVKCLVGKHMSLGALPAEERAEARRRAQEHLELAQRIQEWTGFDLEALFDSSLKRSSEFRELELEYRSKCGDPPPEWWYFVSQFLHFETIARKYGAWLKVGWSILGPQEANRVVSQFRSGVLPHSRCEAAHDSFTLANCCQLPHAGSMAFLYSPAAVTLSRRKISTSAVCVHAAPYSTAFPEDRIMLRRGEDPSSKLPDPGKLRCPHLQCQIVEAIERFRALVTLVGEQMPDLLELREPAALASLDREVAEQQQELEGIPTRTGQSYRAALLRLRGRRLQRAVLLRGTLLPHISKLIETFAVS